MNQRLFSLEVLSWESSQASVQDMAQRLLWGLGVTHEMPPLHKEKDSVESFIGAWEKLPPGVRWTIGIFTARDGRNMGSFAKCCKAPAGAGFNSTLLGEVCLSVSYYVCLYVWVRRW